MMSILRLNEKDKLEKEFPNLKNSTSEKQPKKKFELAAE
jgi:hypothetical protein